MEVAYLGLLSKIFNAIFNAILSPVFKFVSSLLESVLGWLFEEVLEPLLENVLWPIFKGVVDLVFEILAGMIYSIFASLLKIVDAMQTAFKIFAGLKTVTYNGKENSLIEAVFNLDSIQRAMYIILIISFVLTFLFAVVGTARSMFELDFDNPRPVTKVLKSTMRAMIRFMLIPFTGIFLVMMAGRVLEGIDQAMQTSDTTLGRMVFVVASLDACSADAEYNISGKLKDSDTAKTPKDDIGIGDTYRKPFYNGEKDYADKDEVKKSFNFARFDYLIGFGVSIFLLVVLMISMINFICRIFDVMLLYIVSPFFVSMIPLDDGEKFKAWQDMFLAKLFGGFGIVIAMDLYMLLCPSVMAGNIKFFEEGSVEAGYLIRIIFMMGGAWAVIKAGPTITQLLSFQAGSSEREMDMQVSRTTRDTVAMAGSMVYRGGSALKRGIEAGTAARNKAREESDSRISRRLNAGSGGNVGAASQGSAAHLESGAPGGGSLPSSFSGGASRAGGASPSGGSSSSGGTLPASAAEGILENAPGGGTQSAAEDGSEAFRGEGMQTAVTVESSNEPLPASAAEGILENAPGGGAQSAGEDGSEAFRGEGMQTAVTGESSNEPLPASAAEGTTEDSSEASSAAIVPDASAAQVPQNKAARLGAFGKSGHWTINLTTGGHHYLGVDFGKKLSFGRDQEDNFRFSVLGFGFRKGKDGKVDKISIPFLRWKRDSNGSFRISKAKIPLACNLKRTETVRKNADGTTTRTLGKIYCSDLKPLGITFLRRRYDQDTGAVEKVQSVFNHYGKNAEGNYVKTKTDIPGLIRVEYESDGHGKLRAVDTDHIFGSMNFSHDADGTMRVTEARNRGGKQYYESAGRTGKAKKKTEERREDSEDHT